MKTDWKALLAWCLFAAGVAAVVFGGIGCTVRFTKPDECYVYRRIDCSKSCADLKNPDARRLCLDTALSQNKEGCLGLVISPCPEEK